MDRNPKRVKIRYWLHKFALIGVICLLLAGLVYGLFFVNRFYLLVEPKRNSEMTISYGDNFSDPGARCRLAGTWLLPKGIPVDGKFTVINEVDTTVPGDYTVTYDARWGPFRGQGIRNVHVVDDVPPSITLNFITGHYTVPGEPYQEEGFTAYDACDGDLTAQVQVREEDGFVYYTVSDGAGNTAQAHRAIRYCDPEPPVITLLGGETYHIPAGSSYTEPGFTAIDNVDGDLSQFVLLEGEVDPYLASSYILTYTVTDSTGNTATAERIVVVDAAEQAETVDPEEKTVYLTFDDGPSKHTEQLLQVLKKYGVKATFFVIDSDYVDVIQQIVEDGHAIGIHSVSHNYKKIYASTEAFFEDLRAMEDIIFEKTGVSTKLMRFPGGSSNTVSRFNKGIMSRLTRAVRDAGYYYFDWNVDSDDAGSAKDSETVFENVKEGLENHRVSVVLQHDTKDFSIEAVEDIIRWGLKNGYTFRALEQSSPGAHHGVNN